MTVVAARFSIPPTELHGGVFHADDILEEAIVLINEIDENS